MQPALAKQHFFISGRHLGYREVPAFVKIPGFEVRRQSSYAYFCGLCGDIWGRIHVEGAPYTRSIERPCLRHGNGRLSDLAYIEGDFFPYWREDWPPAATEHEFRAFLQEAIKRLEFTV